MFRRLSAVCAVLACFVLLLTSCSPGAAGHTAPTFTGFSCKADIAYRDMTVKGRLSRVSAGTLTLEIEEPATLSGMKLSWDGEQVRVNMLGLSVELDRRIFQPARWAVHWWIHLMPRCVYRIRRFFPTA